MTTPTDENLVARWREDGQQSALAELVDRYLLQFYGTARAMQLSQHAAEEVAQDTMLKVIRSIETFNEQWRFRTWSYTILINTIRSERKRYLAQVNRHAVADVERLPMKSTARDSRLIRDEMQSCIECALQKLTEKQRDAVVMILIDGLPASEVAKIERCSVDAVYQRVTEARRSLRSEPSLKQFWMDDH